MQDAIESNDALFNLEARAIIAKSFAVIMGVAGNFHALPKLAQSIGGHGFLKRERLHAAAIIGGELAEVFEKRTFVRRLYQPASSRLADSKSTVSSSSTSAMARARF